MKKMLAILLLLMLVGPELQAQDVAKPKLRTWKDSTGKFSIEAIFVRISGDQVLLVRADKKELSVPIAKLSVADRNYITVQKLGGSVKFEEDNIVQHAAFERGSELTDAGLGQLREMTNLRGLDIHQTQVTDAGLVHLKGLTKLVSLSLRDNKIGDQGLEHLQGLTGLRSLNLVGTQVSDNGLKYIEKMSNLSMLALGGTQISGNGLAHLKGLTKLNQLFLHSTDVDDEGLAHLRELNNLRMLFLPGTKVTDAGSKRLQQALPNCRIQVRADNIKR